MSFFDRFHKKPSDASLRQELCELVLNSLSDPQGRIRVEDAISAAAIIVAERCIDAAGDFALRDHDLPPGSRAFSTRVNDLISGDVSDGNINHVPKDSIIGMTAKAMQQAQQNSPQVVE